MAALMVYNVKHNFMDRTSCAAILAELQALVLEASSPLCWRIARELADYTVAFIALKNGQMLPAGTGTLVSFHKSHYILTAAHVWEKLLKESDSIFIPLKEKTRQRITIKRDEIIPCETILPPQWNEWGPDITLLHISPERVGSFAAVGRPFYSLSTKKERVIDCGLETWFLMGAPAVRGIFTPESAIPELQGMNVVPTGWFSSTEVPTDIRAQFDFIDIPIDTTQTDVAANFGGVSGGGLWRVYVFKDSEGQIQTFKVLYGVAFWQILGDSSLIVRCHGPASIGSVLACLTADPIR